MMTTITSEKTEGQQRQCIEMCRGFVEEATKMATRDLGRYRTQLVLESGSALFGAVVQALEQAVKEVAPQRTLQHFAVVFGDDGERVRLVAVSLYELGFRGETFIDQVLDQQRLDAWSHDVLKGQQIALCKPWVIKRLSDQHTFIPKKKLVIAEEQDGFADQKHHIHLTELDGEVGRVMESNFGRRHLLDAERLFVFELVTLVSNS